MTPTIAAYIIALTFQITPVAAPVTRICARAVDVRHPLALSALERDTAFTQGAQRAFARGCLALARSDSKAAADAFRAAVELVPTNAVYHFWLGRALGSAAQRANVLQQALLARRARASFERAIQMDSNFVDAHEARMQFALQAPSILGGGEKQVAASLANIQRLDRFRGMQARITVARRGKNDSDVQRAHESFIAAYPDSVTPFVTYLAELETRKSWTRGWQIAERIPRAGVAAQRARYAIGRLAARSGEQLERGEAELSLFLASEVALGDPTPAQARALLGVIFEAQGKLTEARSAFSAALAADPLLASAREALQRLSK